MREYKLVNGRLSQSDAEECVDAVIGSNALEGFVTPPEEREMLLKYAMGEITEDQYMDWVWKRAGVTG